MKYLSKARIIFFSIFLLFLIVGIRLNITETILESNYNDKRFNSTKQGTRYNEGTNHTIYFTDRISFLLAGLVVIF